jgi:hypothetical protein
MAKMPGKRGTTEFNASADFGTESFLGTLRSELDEESQLDGAFAEIYARFVSLRDAYLSGRIDARAFGEQIRDLRVLDDEGMHWTLGATTMRWYVHNPHNAAQWIVAAGPGSGGIVVDATGKPSGWAVEDWQERREQREAERRATLPEAGGSKFEEADTASVQRGRKLTIDEMFDRYVDDDSGQSYAVEASILIAEDLEPLTAEDVAANANDDD